MSHAELDAVFDTVPSLAGRPRTVEELSGGLTNRNVKVTTPDGVFVARCTDLSGNALEIDRDAEHLNSRAAEEAGVGAPVLDYRPDLGVLVVGFIPGRTLGRQDLRADGMLPRVAESCRRLHAGPRFVSDFDMFERQAGYLRTVRREGYRIPDGYLDQAERIDRMCVALRTLAEPTVPCNNDLLAENFVDDGEQVWLIDYEYSGNNDACFELGNIWMECRLDLDQLEELVTCYYGGPRPDKLARARLLGTLGQYGWTLWGAIQSAVSPLDFDFWEWALERHELALSELNGADFERLLHDVQVSD
ncbi:phosphotransferase [Nocardioides sp. YIM 123512]|uniref:Phosphotransferase n=2 Tax=Nocardioides flavescens TaxID=2691959 RepID=A0A6L7F1B1_9ACTN|nr:choline kinase family protein [Nocardioides flavescens]MXG91145.1 phosphotransferase [Nocardioides flavescens]